MVGRWIRGVVPFAMALAALLLTAPAGAAGHTRCFTSNSAPVLAGAAHVGRARVSLARSVGGNGMPQCTFALANKRAPSVTVNVDNGPQAFFRLARTVEEASQIFGPPPPGWHAPIGLHGLGPYASWFPELGSLMAISTNKVDLVTVHVTWPQVLRGKRIALARQIILPFAQRARGSTKDKSPSFPG
jgi:hypothetical protein